MFCNKRCEEKEFPSVMEEKQAILGCDRKKLCTLAVAGAYILRRA
jgi:hypothetical protein